MEKSTFPKQSTFDFTPAGGLLIAELMIELMQSNVCRTGMNVLTFAFDMLMTLCIAISHSFCTIVNNYQPRIKSIC